MNDNHGYTPPPDERAGGASFYTVLRTLRQRWWVVLLCVVFVPAAAYGFTSRQDKEYTATAKLLIRSDDLANTVLDSPAVSDASSESTDLDLAASRSLAGLTAQALHVPIGTVEGKVTVTPRGDSSVVDVQARGPRRSQVARIANRYARTFITYRLELARERIRRAIAVLKVQLGRAQRAEREGNSGLSVSDVQQQLDQAQLLNSLQTGNARVVENARAPASASSPKPIRATVIGLGFGLVLGAGLALLFEFLSRKLNDLDEIEAIYDCPLLGNIPESKPIARPRQSTGLPPNEREAFQKVRANLRHFAKEPVSAALIMSALPGEGKSTVAWNLAVAAAEAGTRVVLLEADMRLPTMVERRDLVALPGLAGLLIEDQLIDQAIQTVPIAAPEGGLAPGTAMDVIPAGPPQPNPTSLVESDRMSEVIRQLRERYELVIIDTPAAAMVADGLALLPSVDGVIVVSRVRKNTRRAAGQLRGQLEHVQAPLLGVVVNGVSRADNIGGYGYGYGYSYGGDGQRNVAKAR